MDERIEQISKEIREKQAQILEDFAQAYLAETGLKPSEVELVSYFEQRRCAQVWYFRKRERV